MTMKRKTIALGSIGLATVLAAGLGGAALAQQAGGMRGPMGGHDPLGDATITRAEAQAKAAEMFAKMDLNHDGKLDSADRAVRIGRRFDAMDANHDGTLSKQEFIDAHMKPTPPGPQGGRPEGMGPGRMGHHGMGGAMMIGMLARMDTNGDKAISRDEFVAGALQRFDAADANHDGKLTPEERRAAFRAGMMKHMRGMGHGGEGMEHGGMGHDMDDMPPPPAGK